MNHQPLTSPYTVREAVLGLVLALAGATLAGSRADACDVPPTNPSPAEQARIHAEDARLRERGPKEQMVLARLPHAGWGRDSAIPLKWWLKAGTAERARFARNSWWEQEKWFAQHGKPRPGTHAYGKVMLSWQIHGRPLWQPVGYGHALIPFGGTCGGRLYWGQRPFAIDPKLDRSFTQPDGTVLAVLTGYRLPRSRADETPRFVVLSYQLCRRPTDAQDRCV